MKIEKLSDNQIRCTLNKSDLSSRQLKISELAYGSEKAKDLFRDMMQQASYELGFEADDIPLMIEAIPVSPDCIILIITKVDDPEELDTRFSKFAPTISSDDDDDSDLPYEDDDTFDTLTNKESTNNNGADDVINLFSKISDYIKKDLPDQESKIPTDNISNINTNSFIPLNESLKNSAVTPNLPAQAFDTDDEKVTPVTESIKPADMNVSRTFSFNTLNVVNDVAIVIGTMYDGVNSLYKDSVNTTYYLVVNKSDCSPAAFNKVCNILSEYGNKEHVAYASVSFYEEHYEVIIKDKAIQVLATL